VCDGSHGSVNGMPVLTLEHLAAHDYHGSFGRSKFLGSTMLFVVEKFDNNQTNGEVQVISDYSRAGQ